MRAKQTTFTFLVDKSSLKKPKMVHLASFRKNWTLQSNSATRLWVIFKQFDLTIEVNLSSKIDAIISEGNFTVIFQM